MLLAQVAPHTWPTLLISPTVPEEPQTVNYHGVVYQSMDYLELLFLFHLAFSQLISTSTRKLRLRKERLLKFKIIKFAPCQQHIQQNI